MNNKKKSVCFYFQVHLPVMVRKYRFFDIGKRDDYFDEYMNRSTVRKYAEECYNPANALMLKLIRKYQGEFRIAYSISGTALEQFELYAPEVLDSFRELADTGCVEFLCETYGHSLASLSSTDEFELQVKKHARKIEELFGQKAVVFRNTSLIYSDEIGDRVYKLGYQAMLTDGAKHVMGWRSPNFIYSCSLQPKLKLLLKNSTLSDDISLRFQNCDWNEYPLTAEKYARWLRNGLQQGEVMNLFMNYETFGALIPAESGIFDFLEYLPHYVLEEKDLEFLTPREVAEKHQTVGTLNVPYPISWSDEERDTTSWLGNELQQSTFEDLYGIQKAAQALNDPWVDETYSRLQSSDHFYYMSTKLFSDGDFTRHRSPYESPYEAFVNYMNVLSDFILRVNEGRKE